MKKTSRKRKKALKGCAAVFLGCMFMAGVVPVSAEEQLAVEEWSVVEEMPMSEERSVAEEILMSEEWQVTEKMPTPEEWQMTEVTDEYVMETDSLCENGAVSGETAFAEPNFTQDVADLIQNAINEGTDLTITINEDLMMNKTICIPAGKTIRFMAAEGMDVTVFCKKGFADSFFFVEEGAVLMLGSEDITTGIIRMEHSASENPGWLASGAGVVFVQEGVEGIENIDAAVACEEQAMATTMESSSSSSSGETVIGESDFGWTMGDLADAVIEIPDGNNLVYSGKEHTPMIQVWVGKQMLMSGFDYDVSYENHVNAGMATVVVTATGFGACTGSGRASFEILPAMPQFTVENQSVIGGSLISDLRIPAYGIGAQGEQINGEVYWSATEGGMALPVDMMLSGMDGDTMRLYWTFYPEENCTNYQAVSGCVTLTFVTPDIPADEAISDSNMWSDMGTLSDSASSSGVTKGNEFVENVPGEASTEETGSDNKPENASNPDNTSDPENTSNPENSSKQNPVSSSKPAASAKLPASGMSINQGQSGTAKATTAATTAKTNGTEGSVTISRNNPRTGDETSLEKWLLLGTAAGIIAVVSSKKNFLWCR